MEIFISIDGVLRNTLQKFDYHYRDYYLNTDPSENNEDDKVVVDPFEYGVSDSIKNDDYLNHYKFQSKEEFNNFVFIDYAMEIFGHAGLSYSNAMTELNTLIYENKEHRFTIIGLDELGKSKPASLFFLSKNGFMGNNVRFSMTSEIPNLWKKCDLWITDKKEVVDSCPRGKSTIKFNTDFNQHFTNTKEIHKLSEIDKTWLKYSGNFITSTLTRLLRSVN